MLSVQAHRPAAPFLQVSDFRPDPNRITVTPRPATGAVASALVCRAGTLLEASLLGMAPSMATPVMGSPYRLLDLPVALSATGGITFSGLARVGLIVPLHSTATIRFGGSARWTALQTISATVPFRFGGSAFLIAAGKPLIVTAVPQSFAVHAANESFRVTAEPTDFVVRGVAH